MELLTIKQASDWASEHLHRDVTPSNIAYLVQYGRLQKIADNDAVCIDKSELAEYYRNYFPNREMEWKEKLGQDLNWHLSFEYLKESETTKHVHRLHPYKGKYIPQLVEYFLNDKTDSFKQEVFFKKGDIVIDPFCGSGTTLVQANELGIHAIGIDISAFNALISNAKVKQYDLINVTFHIKQASSALQKAFYPKLSLFEEELLKELQLFNNIHFPVPEYKYRLRKKEINERSYGSEKEKEFLPVYNKLVEEYAVNLVLPETGSFLERWYFPNIKQEIQAIFEYIKTIDNPATKKLLSVILSRTIRSCRATTHADLATLISPVIKSYYCAKHGKICKPLFSIHSWWERYTKDTLKRLAEFSKIRTSTFQHCIAGDSCAVDIQEYITKKSPDFSDYFCRHKAAGIFSSPPYLGLIDYHEQHAYAYDLLGFARNDVLEIGAMQRGQSKNAKEDYTQSIAKVLTNCKRFLNNNYNVFLVANDKYNLYPRIAELAEMRIVQTFRRPVLNRTEKDKGAYSETIFHLKEML